MKAFDYGYSKEGKFLKEVGIPDHLNLSSEKPVCGPKITVRTLSVTTDCIKIGKGVVQSYIFVTLFI